MYMNSYNFIFFVRIMLLEIKKMINIVRFLKIERSGFSKTAWIMININLVI